MEKLAGLFESRKAFWVSGALCLLLQGFLIYWLSRVDAPLAIFQQQTARSPDAFMVFLDNWGPEKTRIFLQHYWVDFFYPLAYAFFFRCCLTQLLMLRHSNTVAHCLAFPFAAALYDELENLCQMPIVAGWISEKSPLFYAGMFGAYGKWLMIVLTLGALAYGAGEYFWESYLEGKL